MKLGKTIISFMIVALLFSCKHNSRDAEENETQHIQEKSENDLKRDTLNFSDIVGSPCFGLDSSSIIETTEGSIIKYTRLNDLEYSISWGKSKDSLRTLPNNFYCDAPTGSKPRFIEGNENYLLLENNCGNPCWQGFFLPLSGDIQPQIIGMYYDYDLKRELVIYPESDSVKSFLCLKGFVSNSIQIIDLPNVCDSPIDLFCIDSVAILEDEVYYRYDSSTSGKTEEMIEKRIRIE